ncbi:MAG: hypothetical protein NDI61_00710 [Bdellovibrionaceae bacterium]|nr:hypothetical protein [Pseudobdellovibrionaceae bacterium]
MANSRVFGTVRTGGFSIVELMIVVGISSIVLMSMTTAISIMYSMQAQQTLVFTRNEVAARIRMLALTPGALENSAILTNNLGENGVLPAVGPAVRFTRFDRLLKCHPSFTDPAQTGCDRSDMDDPNRGNFVYISDRNSTDPNLALAGEYIHYTTKGTRCSQQEAQNPGDCPIFARAWAEPYCLNFASTCNKAMSISIRYSVGVRSDYVGSVQRLPTTLEAEVIVPLQKGIQITRVLDQDNNALIPNARGIYGVQKYYGYPDQSGNPRALRFEVLVGNPTGLQNIRMQMRALTGPSASTIDDLTVPPSLMSADWTDVPNPDNLSQPWVIPLVNAAQNQLFNFGTVNTIKGFIIGARYDLPNDDLSKRRNLYYMNSTGTGLLPPLNFKSGVYQFRVVALDTGNNIVESTNYATVRIFPRPQMYLSSTTPIPATIYRNCAADASTLTLSILAGDDEELVSSSYEVTAADGTIVGSGETTFSGTTGSFQLTFDKSKGAGTYRVNLIAKNRSSGRIVRGFVIPDTTTSNLPATLVLNEVVPITDLLSNPTKVRVGSTAVATYSLSTGNCCTQEPRARWTFPNVPEVGNVPMLSASSPNEELTCSNLANGTRSCSVNTTINGLIEGPASAAPDISVELSFSGSTEAACQVSNSATVKYIPVVRIPGIQFVSSESLWAFAPAATSTSLKSMERIVRIQADFPPADDPVTVSILKPDSSPICSNITFAAGTSVNPVIQTCTIPSGYQGDMILARSSSNIKTSADAPAPGWRALLVDGKLQHRVCNANIGSSSGPFPSVYTVPTSLPMLNSPWGLDGSGNQKTTNDAGRWFGGATHSLRCWDSWDYTTGTTRYTFYNPNNKQDGAYTIDAYNATRPSTWYANIDLIMSFPTFFFPYNGGSAPDFTARNVPYIFVVMKGAPDGAVYRYTQGTSSSETTAIPWMNVTSSYCNGSTSMTNTQIYTNQFRGFDTSTQTMKALNSARMPRNLMSSYYSYAFVCTYGRYSPFGEGAP